MAQRLALRFRRIETHPLQVEAEMQPAIGPGFDHGEGHGQAQPGHMQQAAPARRLWLEVQQARTAARDALQRLSNERARPALME